MPNQVFEIGFGNGEQMHFAATNEPERDFIGVEVHARRRRLLNYLATTN